MSQATIYSDFSPLDEDFLSSSAAVTVSQQGVNDVSSQFVKVSAV